MTNIHTSMCVESSALWKGAGTEGNTLSVEKNWLAMSEVTDKNDMYVYVAKKSLSKFM